MRWGWLKTVGRVAVMVAQVARQKGTLSDELLSSALELVAKAEKVYQDNSERREWAVAALRATGKVNEAQARLAIELGVAAFKHGTKLT